MKLSKIKLFLIFSFLSLFSFADDLLPWLGGVYSNFYPSKDKHIPYIKKYFTSKQDAISAALKYIPLSIYIPEPDNSSITNISSLIDILNSTALDRQYNHVYFTTFYNSGNYSQAATISNILTHESIDILSLIQNSGRQDFIRNSARQAFLLNNPGIKVYNQNNVVYYFRPPPDSTKFINIVVDFDSFCQSYINCYLNYDVSAIKSNIDILFPYLISQFYNISNSFDRVLSNSDSALSEIQNISSTVGGFSLQLDDLETNTSYLKLKSYSSGTLSDFSFGNPDSYAEGPLFILYQLTRQERGEPENLVVTQREAYNYLGLDKEYGSWPRPNDYQRINQVLATQVAAKTASQEKKYQDLYSIADDDGYVIDPETGEKVSLQDAFKNWNNQKSQGAIANYQYNNPAATNGLLGAIKKSLTDESDWRILDKGFKKKVENFTQEIKDDGIKINQGGNPLRVTIAQDIPIHVDISSENFQGITFSTDIKDPLEQFRDSFNSFFQLWSVYSGVTDKSSRSWLDLINENNSNYYDFVRDKLYVTFSNDLASIVRNTSRTNDFYNSLSNQLERIISSQSVEVSETSPFEIYANKYVSTLKNEIPDAYLISNEDYQFFYGSTNFEQAIIFMLHDQHVIAQNNLKANMMTADYIRGIYHSLYTGSNIAQRVDYITNQVFSANSLSTDPDHDYSSAYSSQADELKTHLQDIVSSIEEFKSQTLEKLTPIANQIFADYILPAKLTVLNFRGNKFQVDLIKYRSIFDLMHYASSVAWLIIGLLMLPRVIYMLLAFSLKILGKFYNIMRNP